MNERTDIRMKLRTIEVFYVFALVFWALFRLYYYLLLKFLDCVNVVEKGWLAQKT